MSKGKIVFILTVDIITLVVIILHIQSYILFIIEDFHYLKNYPIADIILFHKSYGLFGEINSELERFQHINILFLIAICNIPVARYKIKAIKENENLITKKYKYSYIVNIIFIVYQFVDYFIDINMIFSQ